MADAFRFVVVDDSPEDRAIVARALRQAWPDASVTEAADVASASRAAVTGGADVVITDYWLSGATGLEVLSAVRTDGADCPVIMVTGTGNEEVAVEAMRNGFADYILKKPSGLARLPSSVVAALAARDEHRGRAAAEAALEESRSFLDALVNQAPDLVYVFDVDTRRVTFVNQRVESILGYTPDQVVGLGDAAITTLLPADEARRIAGTIERLLVSDGPPTLEDEFRVYDRGGNERWLRGRACVFRRGPDGRVRQLLATALDVTEEHLSNTRSHLLTAALQAAADAIVITNRAGTIQWVNPAFTEMTGYSSSEAIGQTLRSGAQDPAYYRDLWGTVLAGRVWRGRVINRRKDGTTYIEEMSVTPVSANGYGPTPSGEATHFVAIKQDVTAEIEQERLLRAKDEQLRHAQRMDSIGQLAGGVAHDFNNLLTAILGYVDLVLGETPESDARHGDLIEIRNAGDRAADLTRQLLAFSRRQVLTPTIVTVDHVITGVEKMLRRLIREDIQLEIDMAAETPPVRVDVGQLEQVLVNLVVNAADAMPEGGRLRIATAMREVEATFIAGHVGARAGRFVEVVVSDTGVGIARGDLEQIFEPFFTTKPKGKGTGLGLSVVYGIVKQSGGFIWADSAPGAGTTFTILLPESQRVCDVRQPSLAAAAAAPSDRQARILVVDDDESVGQLVEKVLRRHGHDVRQARSAAEAERRCAEWQDHVDLIVVDVVMPDGNGHALAARLASRCAGSRVVMMSGYDDARVTKAVAPTVTHRFLPKPFDPATLTRLVSGVLAPQVWLER